MGHVSEEERKKFPEGCVAAVQSGSLSVAVRGFPACKLLARKTCQSGAIQNILFAHSQLRNRPYCQQHSLSTINMLRTLQGQETWSLLRLGFEEQNYWWQAKGSRGFSRAQRRDP